LCAPHRSSASSSAPPSSAPAPAPASGCTPPVSRAAAWGQVLRSDKSPLTRGLRERKT
jgi:hypothetical protein